MWLVLLSLDHRALREEATHVCLSLGVEDFVSVEDWRLMCASSQVDSRRERACVLHCQSSEFVNFTLLSAHLPHPSVAYCDA